MEIFALSDFQSYADMDIELGSGLLSIDRPTTTSPSAGASEATGGNDEAHRILTRSRSPGHPGAITTDKSGCIARYYHHFHKAHPFLFPERVSLRIALPDFLLDTMSVASLYPVPENSHDHILTLSESLQYKSDSLYKTQALLIMTILWHSVGKPTLSRQCLNQALVSAFLIGINRKDSIISTDAGGEVARESANRTWWELVVCDTLLAAFQGNSFAMDVALSEAYLPVAEEAYTTGEIQPSNATLDHLTNRIFTIPEVEFSSCAYRLDAALLLRDVLQYARQESPFDDVKYQILDARIVSWLHSLPHAKKHVLETSDEVDEMIFQAYLLIHLATIILNIRRSYLLSPLIMTNKLLCGADYSTAPELSPERPYTHKVIRAGNEISRLACLGTMVVEHTPFYTCFLVLGSVVHLSACAMLETPLKEKHRVFLGTNISILQSLGSMWPLALRSRDHLKEAAQEILVFQAALA